MTGKISPRAIGRHSDANNAPKAETAASKLVRKREPSMLVQRYLENSRSYTVEGGSMKRSLELASLALFICLGSGGLAAGQVAINVNWALPSDIAGGAPAATLQQAAAFAWQEFIALN
jgi:hypothetical protein